MSLATQLTTLALALTAAAAPAVQNAPSLVARAGNGKRGIAYNSTTESVTPLFIGKGNIGWAFDWSSDTFGLGSGVDYFPTLFSDQAVHTTNWNSQAQTALNNGAKNFFTFNEPDNVGQANMTPEQAVSAWNQYIQPFAGKVNLCAPAVTNGVGTNSAGIPEGFAWLEAFLDACTGCRIDCVNVHWYSQPQATQYFEEYINNATSYGKPVWLSEFAVSDGGEIITDDNTVNTFLESELPFLDNNANVAGYAYFMAAEGYLVENGALSGYGNTYVTYGGST